MVTVHHTSPQSSCNVENSTREVTYVFWKLRGYTRRPHWQSNQIIWVFGVISCQSWETLREILYLEGGTIWGNMGQQGCFAQATWDNKEKPIIDFPKIPGNLSKSTYGWNGAMLLHFSYCHISHFLGQPKFSKLTYKRTKNKILICSHFPN